MEGVLRNRWYKKNLPCVSSGFAVGPNFLLTQLTIVSDVRPPEYSFGDPLTNHLSVGKPCTSYFVATKQINKSFDQKVSLIKSGVSFALTVYNSLRKRYTSIEMYFNR